MLHQLFWRHIPYSSLGPLPCLRIPFLFLRNTKVDNLCQFIIVINEYVWRLEILVDDFTLVQIPQSRNQLPTYFLDRVNVFWIPMLHNFFFHVSTLDSFHYDVKFVPFLFWEVLSHKIMIFYNIRMLQILPKQKFGIHSPKLSNKVVTSRVINCDRFVNVFSFSEI